jgi:hypothetical protein
MAGATDPITGEPLAPVTAGESTAPPVQAPLAAAVASDEREEAAPDGAFADTREKRAAPARPSLLGPGFHLNARFHLIILVVFAIVAPIGVILGGLQDRKSESAIPGGLSASGRVVAVDDVWLTDGNGERRLLHHPVIRFVDRAGQPITFESALTSNTAGVGDPARVSYDPSNPSNARDLSLNPNGWKTTVGVGIGLVFVELLAAFAVFKILQLIKRASAPHHSFPGSKLPRTVRNWDED